MVPQTVSGLDSTTEEVVHTLPKDRLLQSELVDGEGKLSLDCMLEARRKLQSGTAIRSECVIRLDPKFAL